MDELRRAWYELKFSFRYVTAEGDSFQDLFVQLMQRAHPNDFASVVPWGNVGDLKCDGYLSSERMVFGCYGPKDFSPMPRCIDKITADHHGALHHWKAHLGAWTLVHNGYRGLPAPLVHLLLELQKKDTAVVVAQWGEAELTMKVRGLGEPDLIALFGSAPSSRQVLSLRQDDLRHVIPALCGAIAIEPLNPDFRPVPPEKLEYNKLSDNARLFLTHGMQVSDRVRVFFERWEPGVGDRIAAGFRQRYYELRADAGRTPDDILWALFEFAGRDHLTSTREQTAVLALLAFLFESCEIFDRPPTMSSS